MKKKNWKNIPNATATQSGLMSKDNFIGFNNNMVHVKLTNNESEGYNINTNIPYNEARSSIVFRFIEHCETGIYDGSVAMYINSTGVLSSYFRAGADKLSKFEILNNNGFISVQVTPYNSGAYVSIFEIFYIKLNNAKGVASITLTKGLKPEGATILGTIL